MDVPFWLPTVVAAVEVAALSWRRHRRERRLAASAATAAAGAPAALEIRAEPDAPVGFGRKNSWVAVRTSRVDDVAAALELSSVETANWQSGVAAAQRYPCDFAFVTPPLDGWVLATGIGLPDLGDPGRRDAWRGTISRSRTRTTSCRSRWTGASTRARSMRKRVQTPWGGSGEPKGPNDLFSDVPPLPARVRAQVRSARGRGCRAGGFRV